MQGQTNPPTAPYIISHNPYPYLLSPVIPFPLLSQKTMELHTPNNNGQNPTNPNNNKTHQTHEPQPTFDDFDSTCSTPYVSAPSSPGRGPGPGPVNGGFFYSCPASPMHFAITTTKATKSSSSSSSSHSPDNSAPLGFEFEFSARLGLTESGQPGSMSSADELFLNGQIRPMKLSTHLEKPQVLAPLMDLENEDEDYEDKNEGRSRGRDLKLRDKSLRRRTRSMSPLRRASYEWNDHEEENNKEDSGGARDVTKDMDKNEDDNTRETMTSSVSASSSRSSSAGRSSKRWDFLKDFLYRSKSEGRSNNKFWSTISFSPAKEKKPTNTTSVQASMSKEKLNNVSGKKPVNGVGKRRVPPSPHELHYTAYKAQAEEMKKKTFLPYRQGLLGCLGFSSKGYGAMNGFARALNPVSSR